MGGLALSKVGYDRYLKFVWPFVLGVFLVCCDLHRDRRSHELRVKGEPA